MAKTNKKINKLRKRKTSRKIKRRLSKKRFSKKRFNRTRKRGGKGFHNPSSIRRKFEEANGKGGWDAVRIEEEIEKLKKLISDKDEFFEKFEVENRGNQSVDFDDWNKTYRPRAFEEIKTLEEQLQALKKE